MYVEVLLALRGVQSRRAHMPRAGPHTAPLARCGATSLPPPALHRVAPHPTARHRACAACLCLQGVAHAVLVGDHCQLPPTCLSTLAAARGLSTSLFARLIGAGAPASMLQVQVSGGVAVRWCGCVGVWRYATTV